MKKYVLTLAACLLASFSSFAIGEIGTQKLGYINSQELLSVMPEMAKADTDLKAFAKQYQDQLEAMGKEFEKKGSDYQAGEKTMSDAVKMVKQKELQDLESRIRDYQQSAQDKIAKKKEELYKPILDKADKAIREVAKEKGYSYIFDASSGMLLFANDGDNVLPLVKAKLGIK
ncbi:MAG: OmpH family outer membrane protein [Bacteroidetes bacterium]|nr:OmpH family outer membrane protein [Bacteroidota bacterium]MBS1628861.1 OmpH family outer membrane protein [Bacteroidota bacterium]